MMTKTRLEVECNLELSRYLFNKVDILYSLERSILSKDKEASLYWLYELTESGWIEEAWSLVRSVYHAYFLVKNPNLQKYVIWQKKALKNKLELPDLVLTLCMRSQDGEMDKVANEKFLFRLTPEMSESYRTVVYPLGQQWKVLGDPRVNKFALYQQQQHHQQMMGQKNQFHYLEYCVNTPVWRERLGQVDYLITMERGFEFLDDDQMETFASMWNLEPDEQSLEVEKRHGWS